MQKKREKAFTELEAKLDQKYKYVKHLVYKKYIDKDKLRTTASEQKVVVKDIAGLGPRDRISLRKTGVRDLYGDRKDGDNSPQGPRSSEGIREEGELEEAGIKEDRFNRQLSAQDLRLRELEV